MNRDRFRFFPSVHHESDLLIGVPHLTFSEKIISSAREEQVRLHDLLTKHIHLNPSFASSLEPIDYSATNLSPEIRMMLRCGTVTGTGPMSSVAGLFAETVGSKLTDLFGLDEIVVENGGDLFVKNRAELVSSIHAGKSPLSDKMAFLITPGSWGICTSSGTLGHSYSQGIADAVTVIAESTPLADAWATSLANLVHSVADIEPVLDKLSGIPEILGCAIILNDRIGIRGQFQVQPLS